MSMPNSHYSEEIARRICDAVASGQTLASICKASDMPTRANVWRWTEKYPLFRDALTRARLAQADTFADEIVDIADNDEDYQRAKNRIDARRWAAKVINPQRYGDRLDLNVTERPNLADIRANSLANLPADVAQRLTGSTAEMLAEPIETDLEPSKRDDDLADLLE